MATLTEDFDSFVEEISLNKTKIDDIISKHNSLTKMIKDNPPEKYEIVKTRLSGSYAKHTVLNEYDIKKKPDVDVIIVINTNEEDVDVINDDFLSYLKSKKANVVSEIRQQSNSIGLIYSNISVDIVLAKETNNNGGIRIASNKRHDWVESNSLLQVDYMKKRKSEYEGFSYHSLMKLFKYLNKELLDVKLKSYTLEQLVHQCSPKPRVGLRLYQAFAETLDNISKLNAINDIKDCCDRNKEGYDEKDINIFDLFLSEIRDISQLASEAISGNRKKWEEIFGDRFPTQPSLQVKCGANYDKKQTPWSN